MNSENKTTKFTQALDKYFSELELNKDGGQWRTCRFSGEKFYIRPEDIVFYKKVGAPLPTLSPRERTRRKLAFLNSYNLFKTPSAHSGKSLIAQFPPNTPYKVYEHQVWFGEGWNPEDYRMPANTQKSFFEQYQKLQYQVPRPNLFVDPSSVNSDYTNNSRGLKNCYLVFDSVGSEDCGYSIMIDQSRNCWDSFTLTNCDTCYGGLESSNCYKCFFFEYSRDCLESAFLYDCRNCVHCFGGVNLRNKQYYFFNEPLSREEYERQVRAIDLGDRKTVGEYQDRFAELKKKAIHKENHNERLVNSVGDYLKNVKNCHACFYMVGSENCAYSVAGLKNRDSYDVVGGVGLEFGYDTYGGAGNYAIKFSQNLTNCREVEYSNLCVNCRDCFGCIGLKNKSFCVFNRQYGENEYWRLVDELKTAMLQRGEYGEFFPPTLAPIPYNISVATSYSGYDDAEVAKKYGYWIEEVSRGTEEAAKSALDPRELSLNIKDIGKEVLESPLLDAEHQRKFLIIPPELEFYKNNHLPLPEHHPSERLLEKRKRFGPILFEFYPRICAKCNKKIQAVYSSDRPEIVYCEACYNSEVV